jgi:hypothetical protein
MPDDPLAPDPRQLPEGIVTGRTSLMDYGFVPSGLILAKDIPQAEHDALILNSDVFSFPDNLDQPVTNQSGIDDFFEAINLPTDWMTPATTYREFMRQTAGMFQFNQRYGGIAAAETGQLHSIFDNANLNTRLRQMTDDEERWFRETATSFGFPGENINDSSRLRQLVKSAGDFWAGQPFFMGGVEF